MVAQACVDGNFSGVATAVDGFEEPLFLCPEHENQIVVLMTLVQQK